MTRTTGLLALVALLPLAASVPARAEPSTLELPLCGGGSMRIPVDAPANPDGRDRSCSIKGCHADRPRRTVDRKQ